MTRVAWLGLGAMGKRMACQVKAAGYKLIQYNRSSDRAIIDGVRSAGTPAEAAEQADIVIAMLTNDEASREVWTAPKTGAIHGMRPGTIAVECSTLSVDWIDELDSKMNVGECRFVHAPVIGTLPQADAGELHTLVGGPVAARDQVIPVLKTFSAALHQLDAPTAASAMKLGINGWLVAQLASACEILSLAKQHGVDLAEATQFLCKIPLASQPMRAMLGLIAADDHKPRFPINLAEKDLAYLQRAGQSASPNGLRFEIASACQSLLIKAINSGLGERNITALIDSLNQTRGPEYLD